VVLLVFKILLRRGRCCVSLFQCALLYTTTSGQRRIRLHTLALPTTDLISNVFKGADLDAQIAVMVRKQATQVGGPEINQQPG
jgi:protein transport protein SEC24